MKKDWIINFLLIVVTASILASIFTPVLNHPNGILYGKTIDPIKSYYNFSYYLKYDSGIKHDGINYPYGDHLQYINSHPIYVTVLKFVDNHLFPIANYGVAILNSSMILSFLIGIPILFLLLRKFELPRWYAFLIALALGFLNPQFDRIHGHFEMVYWFFIPLYWYLLIRFREKEKPFLWGSLLVLAGVIGGFISAYFAAFYAIFIFAVILAELWVHRKSLKSQLKPALQLLLLAAIPAIAVKGLVGLTDWVHDRPTNPYGFYVYHANIFSIFLPSQFPLKHSISQLINLSFQWEGRAFVGVPATILAIYLILKAPLAWFRKRKPDWDFLPQTKSIQIYLLASVFVLLFSMCFPFKWGLGILLDILPPVKQFRALGRFSWIFYYVFTIYTAIFIFHLFKKYRYKYSGIPAYFVLVAALLSWGFSAKYNTERATRNLFNVNDKLSSDDSDFLKRFESSNIDPSQFQAIFALPFASTCGDKLLFENGTNALVEAMKCSHHTRIPLVQSFSPRLSFSQALSSIQLLADSAIRKTRLDDMNDKPLLLITTKQKLTAQEQWMASHAEPFWEDQYITMGILPIDFLTESHQHWLEYVKETVPELHGESPVYSDTSLNAVYYNGFNDHSSEFSFSGEGSIYKQRGKVELFNGKLPVDSGMVDLSFWLYFDTRRYDMPQPVLSIFDENDQLVSTQKLNNRQTHNIFENWVRISTQIMANRNNRYQLTVKGRYITVDDLLIKPEQSAVLISSSGKFDLFNNFPIN